VALSDDLDGIAASGEGLAAAGERLEAILIAEAAPGDRAYLCAFLGPSGRSWVALGEDGAPVTSRNRVREAVSIAAMCEVAVEQLGAAARRLEQALGARTSPFAAAMRQALRPVEELAKEVESQYKLPLT